MPHYPQSHLFHPSTQAQMQHIQSLMDPNNEEQSFQDSLMGQEEVIGDNPMPVAETPHIDNTNY
jgi:hypothetical protein